MLKVSLTFRASSWEGADVEAPGCSMYMTSSELEEEMTLVGL